MKTLLTLLLWLPLVADAQTITLRWDAYPTPQGHTIEAWCKVGDGGFLQSSQAPADQTAMSIDRAVAPGESLACKVRAVRTSDNAASAYTPEVVYARPLNPATPTGLAIDVAP